MNTIQKKVLAKPNTNNAKKVEVLVARAARCGSTTIQQR